jgi:NADH-quinone oxidoreductase subunit N
VIEFNFTLDMFIAILPEIGLLVLAAIVLIMDVILPRERRRVMGWIVAGGLFGIIIVSIFAGRPGMEAQLLWGGMVRFDWLAFIFKMIFLFGAAVTALFAMDVDNLGNRGEFYLLLLVATMGMGLMAAAGDLILLYLAIETTSIPLYVLAGFMTKEKKSTESGFKYLFFGALTSAIMLYGFSLLYGFAGTTSIYDLAAIVQQGDVGLVPLFGVLLLVLVGFGFKISAVPFHFWAPDVYEGAPTPVTGFLSTASKAAGFAVLMRVLLVVFPESLPSWTSVVAILSVASMTLGNSLALAQRNMKRLLAYSSIAHAGYALIGVVAFSPLGMAAVVYYLGAYLLTNLAAFGVVVAFWRVTGSDEIADYAGLSRRAPGLSLALMVAFLSLAGMPPLGGFIGKVLVFAAAVDADLIWLALVGIINSIVGLYYYLTVLKVVYLFRSEDEEKPLPISRSYTVALVILTLGIVLTGTLIAPFFAWGTTAAAALF